MSYIEEAFYNEQDEADFLLNDEIDAYHNEPVQLRCVFCQFTATMSHKQADEGNWYLCKGMVLCPDHSYKAEALEAIPCPF